MAVVLLCQMGTISPCAQPNTFLHTYYCGFKVTKSIRSNPLSISVHRLKNERREADTKSAAKNIPPSRWQIAPHYY